MSLPPTADEFCSRLDSWAERRNALSCLASTLQPPQETEEEMVERLLVEAPLSMTGLNYLTILRSAVGYERNVDWLGPLFSNPFTVLGEKEPTTVEVHAVTLEDSGVSFTSAFPRDVKEFIVGLLDARSLFIFSRTSRECHQLAAREIELRKRRIQRTESEWQELSKVQLIERRFVEAVRKGERAVVEWTTLYNETASEVFSINQDVSWIQKVTVHINGIDVELAKRLYRDVVARWSPLSRKPSIMARSLADREMAAEAPYSDHNPYAPNSSFADVGRALVAMTQEIELLLLECDGELDMQRSRLKEAQDLRRPYAALVKDLFQLQADWGEMRCLMERVFEEVNPTQDSVKLSSALPSGEHSDWATILNKQEFMGCYWNWMYAHPECEPFRCWIGEATSVFGQHQEAVQYRHILLWEPARRAAITRPAVRFQHRIYV